MEGVKLEDAGVLAKAPHPGQDQDGSPGQPDFQASLLLQKGGSGRRSEEHVGRRVDTVPPRPPATQERLV